MRVLIFAVAIFAAAASACRTPVGPEPIIPRLAYDSAASPLSFRWPSASDPYLVDFDQRYAIRDLVKDATSDLERARIVSHWVHGRFAHDGDHASSAGDPIGILVEAAKGQKFRCVEYATVTSGALNAIGITSRVVWLLTYDEPTRTDGLAHVVAEAYLADAGRWAMIDAQWDVIPTVSSDPASILELQQALWRNRTELGALSGSGMGSEAYARWVTPYLYYLYTPTDARVGVTRTPGAVVLSPIGDSRMTAKYPAPGVIHTHSLFAFYRSPER